MVGVGRAGDKREQRKFERTRKNSREENLFFIPLSIGLDWVSLVST